MYYYIYMDCQSFSEYCLASYILAHIPINPIMVPRFGP